MKGDSAVRVDKSQRIDLYLYDACGGPRQDVGATEYSYGGLPATPSAGVLNVKLTNTGKEDHELRLVTQKAGVTESFDQILGLSQDQAEQKVDTVGQVSASAGKADAFAVELKPGHYLAFCTVAKGAAGDKQGDGPPHFTLGMKQEITVN